VDETYYIRFHSYLEASISSTIW